MIIDPKWKQSATPRQSQIMDAISETGSIHAASRKLGISRSTIKESLQLAENRASVASKPVEKKPSILGQKSLRNMIVDNCSIVVLTDMQARPDIDLAYFYAVGRWVGHKRPDKIVCLGDWADMASLSSYEKGHRSAEGGRYLNDIESSKTAMTLFYMGVIDSLREDGVNPDDYKPVRIMLLGNHEDRIDRASRIDPALFGTISTQDLQFRECGWQVVPFLEVKIINGIAFSHYFRNGNTARQGGFGTAQLQLNKIHMSCIAGHQQGFQMATGVRGDGKRMVSIIAGSGYPYDMPYMGPQGNYHWRGILMLHNVNDGEFDLVQIPIEYLLNKYLSHKAPMYFVPATE